MGFGCFRAALALVECNGERGTLMVVITSDLAVPYDIDAVKWEVTLPGETAPYRSGSKVLVDPSVFPATIALNGGPETTGPVRIHLTASHAMTVRVEREVVARVPESGTVELVDAAQLAVYCRGPRKAVRRRSDLPCGALRREHRFRFAAAAWRSGVVVFRPQALLRSLGAHHTLDGS